MLRRSSRRDATPEQIARIKRMALRVAKLRGHSKHEHILVLADMVEEAGWPKDGYIPTGRKGPPETWDVASLDVWGNADDGFEVNQQFRAGILRVPTYEHLYNVLWYRNRVVGGQPLRFEAGQRMGISSGYYHDDDDFWRRFKAKYLKSTVKRKEITFDSSSGDFIEVNAAKDGEPLYILEMRERR